MLHVRSTNTDNVSNTIRDAYARRYREMPASLPELWSETLSTILGHRSVRAFLPDKLPDGTLEAMIAAAQSAASSSNLQTWSAVAVKDPARRARIAAHAGRQAFIEKCPLFLVWVADLHRLRQIAANLDETSEALDYFETFIVAVIDAALAAQSAVVAAESLGLGTVYVGAVRNDLPAIAEELRLPPHVLPLFGLCVGYPDPAVATEVKPRLPQAAVLHHELYDWGAQRQPIARYDTYMEDFRHSHGMSSTNWSQHAISRVRDVQSLHGRETVRSIAQELGFDLK